MSGRFPIRDELRRHTRAFTGFAQEAGTTVLWYRFDADLTVTDDVYDEETSTSRTAFHAPRHVYALNIDTPEGIESKGEGGFYTTDRMRGVFSTEHLRRAGLPAITRDIFVDRTILKDRIVYDTRLWSPTDLQFQGNVGDSNLTFTLLCEEVDDDEFMTVVGDFAGL